MAPKKSNLFSSPKKQAKFAKAAVKQTKKQTAQIGKTFSALRNAIGQFISKPKPKPKKAKVSKPATAKAKPATAKAKPVTAKAKPATAKAKPAKAKPIKPTPPKSKPTKAVPKKLAVAPGAPSYTLQELASSKSRNLATLFSNVEKNAAKIDALKTPQQMWSFKIYDRYSITPFFSIGSVANFLANSRGLDDDDNPNLYDRISFLTTSLSPTEFQSEVSSRHVTQRQARLERNKKVRSLVGGETTDGRRLTMGEQAEILADQLIAERAEKESIIDGLLARILELENRTSKKAKGKAKGKAKAKKAKAKKAVPKKAAKKSAPKSTSKKATSKKPTPKKAKVKNEPKKHTPTSRPSSTGASKSKAKSTPRAASKAKSTRAKATAKSSAKSKPIKKVASPVKPKKSKAKKAAPKKAAPKKSAAPKNNLIC